MNAKVEINWDKLDALLQFKVTLGFCADYLGCSTDAIQRRVKETHNLNFTEYSELKRSRTALTLQQKALEMAIGGHPTMLIFSLKNLAQWSDKQETTHKAGKEFLMNYDVEKKRTT